MLAPGPMLGTIAVAVALAFACVQLAKWIAHKTEGKPVVKKPSFATKGALRIILSFGLTIVFGYYLLKNRTHPEFWPLVLGSVLLAVVIGIVTYFIQRLIDGNELLETRRHQVAGLVLLPCLALTLGWLLYLFNEPTIVSREISIVYRVNATTGEMSQNWHFPDLWTSDCHDIVRTLFADFKTGSDENAEKVNALINSRFGRAQPVIDGDPLPAVTLLRDLTEYAVLFCLASSWGLVQIPNTQNLIAEYRDGHAREQMMVPDPSIFGELKPLEDILGLFGENLFYGLHPSPFGLEIERQLPLPKDTQITHTPETSWSSKIVIKNSYVTVKISSLVRFPGGKFGEPERNTGDLQYETAILYDAKFCRFRYGYEDMQYYEVWVDRLFSALERKFAWGTPEPIPVQN